MSEVLLSNVAKAYGAVRVIHGIDLAIKSGEFVVFVGPSGCGKSTLLRMIAGLEDITRARSASAARSSTSCRRARATSRWSSRTTRSIRTRRCSRTWRSACGCASGRSTRSRRAWREAAAILQITHLLERKPRELSGGQRQRVAMGRAIVRQPKAFLFDEPLSNLDALLRAEMRVEIKKLHQKLGNTIIYVTHDQVEAMTLADRIVVLQAGNLVQYDTPDGIYNRPAAQFVAGFTGSPPMNFLPCRVGEGGRALHLAGGVDLPVPARRVAECARARRSRADVRPAARAHQRGRRPRSRTRSRCSGRVMLVEPLGSDTLALVRLGDGADAGEMTGRFSPEAGLKVGAGRSPVSLALSGFTCSIRTTGSRGPRAPIGSAARDRARAARIARDNAGGRYLAVLSRRNA